MRFRVRLHDPSLFVGNPGGLVLEITEELGPKHIETRSYRIDREDIANLSALGFALNAGQPLPIEFGEP